jgi:hypothetical protein
VPLPTQIAVDYLIERARGARVFRSNVNAELLLSEARDLALAHGLNRSVFEADRMLTERTELVETSRCETRLTSPDPAALVSVGLRKLLASIEA